MAQATDLFVGVTPFVATADALSFRRAAQKLGVTASAVSKAVAKLEADLGAVLLQRTSRRVTLTAEGEAFLARCREAMDQVRAGRELILQAQRAPHGILRVSLPLALGRQVIVPALPRLLGRYPGLTIHASLTDRQVRLGEEGFDATVRLGAPGGSTRPVMRRLGQVRWVTVAAPSYLGRHGTPSAPRELARHNCLAFELPSGLPADFMFSVGGKAIAVRPVGSLVADHGEALVEAAAAGLGILQAHDYMVTSYLQSGRLVEVLHEHAAPGPPIMVLCAPGRVRAPTVRAFLSFMTELLNE